jgi:hypothetical protein
MSFKDWVAAVKESSPATRSKTAAALGIGPDVADVFGHSTPAPWIVEKLLKKLGDKPKKHKKDKIKGLDEKAMSPDYSFDQWIRDAEKSSKDIDDDIKKAKDKEEDIEKEIEKKKEDEPKTNPNPFVSKNKDGVKKVEPTKDDQEGDDKDEIGKDDDSWSKKKPKSFGEFVSKSQKRPPFTSKSQSSSGS